MDSFSNSSVNQVFDFSSCKAWRHLGQLFGIDVTASLNLTQVVVKYIFSAVNVRLWHMDLLIETTRSHCGRIQSILMISSANH